MRIRRVSSLTALLSFIVMVMTSIILYITPQGRVAYWADWRLWGLSKTQWGDIHINTGVLFLIALGFHIYYNWKPVLGYLKDESKNLKIFTREFNIALLLLLAFVLGTYAKVPPFSGILALSGSIKDSAAEKYGEPPYGHAELSSLKSFTKKMGMDLKESMVRLEAAGYGARDTSQTLAEIAAHYDTTPQQVYLAMKPPGGKSSAFSGKPEALPNLPPAGTGSLTIVDFCSRYNLNMKVVLRGLNKRKINARQEMTIKQVAEENGIGPMDIYENIKEIIKTATPIQMPENNTPVAGESRGIGLGRLTLEEVCRKNSISVDSALRKLSEMGIEAGPEDKVRALANDGETTPFELVESIKQGR